MPRSRVVLLLFAAACSQKKPAPADAGAPALAPGFLGTDEPDAVRPGAHPVDLALGDEQRPCALLSSGEIWCWRLDLPDVFPGRVPGTWTTRADGIRAAHGRLLLHANGQYSLFHGADVQANAARHRVWFRNAPVALGSEDPGSWQCGAGTSTCLVGNAHGLRWIDDTHGGSSQTLQAPALCAGVALDLVFAPDASDQPWIVRCGAKSLLLGAFLVPGAVAPTVVGRPIDGLPKGSRIVGWHGDGRVEVQSKDGTFGVYFAPIVHDLTHAEWTGSTPQLFAASGETFAPPARSAGQPPCTLDGSEVVCAASAPPALAERARKLAASFLAAPRQLWSSDAVACAWGAILEGSWGVRCVTVHDDAPRDVAF